MPARCPTIPVKDFVPIAIFCVSTTSIAVHPSVPAKNVKELVAYVKANTGKLSYGSAGTGTMSHLSGELFKQRTGLTDVVHVPYKGAGPGIADLVSGHIPMMSPNVTGQLLEFHNTGKIRILAVNSPDAPEGRAGHSDRHRAGRAEHGRAAFPRHLRAGQDARARRRAPDRREPRRRWRSPQFEKALIDFGLRDRVRISARTRRWRYMAEEHARWKPVVDAIGLKTR